MAEHTPPEHIESYDPDALIGAFREITEKEASPEEIRFARHIAKSLFGHPHDGVELVSQTRQALAVLHIDKAVAEWSSGTIDLNAVLGICEGCALTILREFGVSEYPYNLPKGHHPLAQDALRLLIQINELIQHVKGRMGHHDGYSTDGPHLVREGARFMRNVLAMGFRWLLPDIKRGQRRLEGPRNSSRKNLERKYGPYHWMRWEKMVTLWNKIQSEHPDRGKGAIDKQVAEEFKEKPKTVQRARLRYTKKIPKKS